MRLKKRVEKLERKILALERYFDIEFTDEKKEINMHTPFYNGYNVYQAYYKKINRCKKCNNKK